MAKRGPKPENCLNCGETITGSYCPNCGQKNTSYRESIWHVVADLLEEAISFDSRLYRSIYLLIFRPGMMTKEYNEGKRVKYIRPLRIYLFSSIVYFFILSMIRPAFLELNGSSNLNLEIGSEGVKVGGAADSTVADVVDSVIAGRDSTDIENVHILTLDEFIDGPLKEEMGDSLENVKVIGLNFDEWDSLSQKWKADVEEGNDNFVVRTGKSYSVSQIERLKGMSSEELERTFLNTFQRNLPTMVFFLLPVFALILKVLYPLSKRYYIEHLIFSLHFHAFLFLLLTVLLVIDKSAFYAILPVITMIYLFLAMRTAYFQSFFATLGKLLLLMFFYWLSLAIVFMTTVLATFVFM